MEELHKTHKDVPFGWVLLVQPTVRAVSRWLRGADVPGASQRWRTH